MYHWTGFGLVRRVNFLLVCLIASTVWLITAMFRDAKKRATARKIKPRRRFSDVPVWEKKTEKSKKDARLREASVKVRPGLIRIKPVRLIDLLCFLLLLCFSSFSPASRSLREASLKSRSVIEERLWIDDRIVGDDLRSDDWVLVSFDWLISPAKSSDTDHRPNHHRTTVPSIAKRRRKREILFFHGEAKLTLLREIERKREREMWVLELILMELDSILTVRLRSDGWLGKAKKGSRWIVSLGKKKSRSWRDAF